MMWRCTKDTHASACGGVPPSKNDRRLRGGVWVQYSSGPLQGAGRACWAGRVAQGARLHHRPFLLCGLAGLLVLGGGVAGVVRAVVRHGVLGAGGPAGGHLACLGGGVC
jgi:hypothetical protein